MTPDPGGTIIEGSSSEPKLGFWLMPNNQVSGMLEDFCAELAEPESLSFAQECVEQAQINNLSTFKEVHRSKAIIHTALPDLWLKLYWMIHFAFLAFAEGLAVPRY